MMTDSPLLVWIRYWIGRLFTRKPQPAPIDLEADPTPEQRTDAAYWAWREARGAPLRPRRSAPDPFAPSWWQIK